MFGNYWIHIIVITTTNDYASPMLCYAIIILKWGTGREGEKRK